MTMKWTHFLSHPLYWSLAFLTPKSALSTGAFTQHQARAGTFVFEKHEKGLKEQKRPL